MQQWTTTGYKTIRSSITDRDLIVNKNLDHVLIPPTFQLEAARQAASAAVKSFSQVSCLPSPAVRPYIHEFMNINTFDEFTYALDNLLNTGFNIKRKGNADQGRMSDLLIALWLADCVALPCNSNHLLGRHHRGRIFWGIERPGPRPEEIIEAFTVTNNQQNRQVTRRLLLTLMFSIVGVREIGDLTPAVVDGFLSEMKLAPSLSNMMITIMRHQYGKRAVDFSYNDYGPFGKKGFKDAKFTWIKERHPELEQWRKLAEDWLEPQKNIMSRRIFIEHFLRYILENKNIPRNPTSYLSSGTTIDPAFSVEVAKPQCVATVSEFVNWILDTRFMAEDDNGHPYRLPGFRNPITAPKSYTPNLVETVREAMPTRFVRRLKEILEEDDFNWPRTAFQKFVDTIRWRDPATGSWHDVWSPVRALAILMKLEIPERSFQVRVCNSGEADLEAYDVTSDRWHPNSHPLAGQCPYGKSMGLARKITDHRTGKRFTGLYFNTNKTGDLGKSPEERGHVIPWQNERVLLIYDHLRTWQEKYNPVVAPTKWADIHETIIQQRYSRQTLVDRQAETFLFRDACSKYPDEPLAATRMVVFWNRLCAELESRLELEGETGSDGEPIKFVTRNKRGLATGTVYNLHSLRVTMITAWAEVGVPIEILMKVAGHATAIMTIFYQKQSISHITDLLNTASASVIAREQDNWQSWLKSKSYDELKSLVAFNELIGLSHANQAVTASIARRDYGLCPVGCGRCHEGGGLVEGSTTKYLPVPGGPQNCVRCRFFITGPCFLIGLHAHFNDISFRYREASKAYVQATTDFEKLDHQRKRCVSDKEPFVEFSKLNILAATLDQRTKEVDELALNWHATFNLIQQCLEIVKLTPDQQPSNQTSLILNGALQDLEFVLELDEAGSREFELLDRICQSSVFFTSVDSRVPNLYRMRHFDQLLQRNGYEPLFFQMSEAQALAAGNQFARFLFLQFGESDVGALMTGERTLRSLGMEAEESFSRQLSELGGHKVVPRISKRPIDI